MSKVTPNSNLSQYLPEGVDAKNSVLVFRDTAKQENRRFRTFYWLSKINGKWMVVNVADGWDSLEPLASAARALPDDGEVDDGVSQP